MQSGQIWAVTVATDSCPNGRRSHDHISGDPGWAELSEIRSPVVPPQPLSWRCKRTMHPLQGRIQ